MEVIGQPSVWVVAPHASGTVSSSRLSRIGSISDASTSETSVTAAVQLLVGRLVSDYPGGLRRRRCRKAEGSPYAGNRRRGLGSVTG